METKDTKKIISEESDGRLRILYLYQMLLKDTDESHTLSTPEILRRMKEEHGILMHRTTLPRDIEVLRAVGIDVLVQRRQAIHYSLPERTLSIPELRLLIDAVLASRFISEEKSAQLTEKLMTLVSTTGAQQLRRTVHATGKPKSENEKGYYIIDVINEGIREQRKISFCSFEYDNKKRHVLRNGGAPYTVSPYDLIWDGDYYYLVGYCDERGEVRTFRVDHIERQPELLEEAARPRPRGYRVEKYTREVFRMFTGQEATEVRLRCKTEAMRAVIDQFGPKVRTRATGEDGFVATVKVCTGPTFYRWVFGWGDAVVIDGPETVKAEYKGLLERELERI